MQFVDAKAFNFSFLVSAMFNGHRAYIERQNTDVFLAGEIGIQKQLIADLICSQGSDDFRYLAMSGPRSKEVLREWRRI